MRTASTSSGKMVEVHESKQQHTSQTTLKPPANEYDDPNPFFHCKDCKRPVHRLPVEGTKRAFASTLKDPCPYCEYLTVENKVRLWDETIEQTRELCGWQQKRIATTSEALNRLQQDSLNRTTTAEEQERQSALQDRKAKLSEELSEKKELEQQLLAEKSWWIPDWEERWLTEWPKRKARSEREAAESPEPNQNEVRSAEHKAGARSPSPRYSPDARGPKRMPSEASKSKAPAPMADSSKALSSKASSSKAPPPKVSSSKVSDRDLEDLSDAEILESELWKAAETWLARQPSPAPSSFSEDW